MRKPDKSKHRYLLQAFLLICIGVFAGSPFTIAQPGPLADLPCSILREDSILSYYFEYHHSEDREDTFARILNMDQTESCIDRKIEDLTKIWRRSDTQLVQYFAENDAMLFAVLVDNSGDVRRSCHYQYCPPSDDQFLIVNCLEKMQFLPAIYQGKPRHTLCLLAISNEEKP